jgi:PiT family inorganic phosphate transporter
VGSAVADTIAGIVTVSPAEAVAVIGAGALAAVLWNLLTWWRGLPSSSAHALVGGLVGSAFAEAGVHAINWGGLDGLKPVGILGVLIALAVSPLLGLAFGYGCTGPCAARPSASGRRSAAPSGRCPLPSHSATEPTTRRSRWG